MRLSPLQQFILKKAYAARGRVDRVVFLEYYNAVTQKPDSDAQTKIITKSLTRLIDKGLCTAYGHRTPEKWYIEQVEITRSGIHEAKKLFGQQQRLPLRRMRSRSHK